jgi:hypothetical protein
MNALGTLVTRFSLAVMALVLLSGCDVLQSKYVDTLHEVKVTVEKSGSGDSYGQELFPFETGNKWVYLSASDSFQWEVTDRFTAINMVQADVVKESTPAVSFDRYFLVSKKGVFDHGSQNRALAVPVPRLHFPVRSGKKWSVESGDADIQASATVEGIETVGTPTGLHQALRIVYVFSDFEGSVSSIERMWFAPTVGVVKMELDGTTYLLRHFEAGTAPPESEDEPGAD